MELPRGLASESARGPPKSPLAIGASELFAKVTWPERPPQTAKKACTRHPHPRPAPKPNPPTYKAAFLHFWGGSWHRSAPTDGLKPITPTSSRAAGPLAQSGTSSRRRSEKGLSRRVAGGSPPATRVLRWRERRRRRRRRQRQRQRRAQRPARASGALSSSAMAATSSFRRWVKCRARACLKDHTKRHPPTRAFTLACSSFQVHKHARRAPSSLQRGVHYLERRDVSQVLPGNAAADGGVEAGSRLLAVDGRPVLRKQ